MDMNDEDAPPSMSLHDTAAWAPSHSNTPHFKNGSSSGFGTPSRSTQQNNPLTPNAPPTIEKPKPHFLTIFGYPASSHSAYATLSKSFSSMATGDIAPPEEDENGGNWFTIGYFKQADAKRALTRDGEIVRDEGGSIRYMIGVRWRDSRSAENDLGASGSGSSRALVRAGGFGGGSPLQPASTAFRKPEPPKANVTVDQGVPGIASLSPSKSGNGNWISSVGDMIFGW